MPPSEAGANPDTKRKSKRTKLNACKVNKQMHEKHIDQLPLPKAITMLKGLKKHEDKEQSKTKHEAARSINHKATQNKNTVTTALERPVK